MQVASEKRSKLEKSNVEEIFELSMIQKGMLFHHLKGAQDNLYNAQLSQISHFIYLTGPGDR